MLRFIILSLCICFMTSFCQADHIRRLQETAIEKGQAEFGHWGWVKDKYITWSTHSNRLIPVYSFGTLGAGDGIELNYYSEKANPYRSEEKLEKLYGYVPERTLNSEAKYFDQTNIFDIQKAALDAGKKHIILVVFDGMDWQTTRNASIHLDQQVNYDSGRGAGLFFQDYDANGTSEFGAMVTSPWSSRSKFDVNNQTAAADISRRRGGYAYEIAGSDPWSRPEDIRYLISRSESSELDHAYTDSSSSATSMTSGIKTYNAAVNVDHQGNKVDTIAHLAQRQGYRVGVVTSVPISHATPASAYSHNVSRDDYQDLTRDLLGLPSISHPENPLPGVDLLIGSGFGAIRSLDNGQGDNFIPGNAYLTSEDQLKSDIRNGGRYLISERSAGVNGREQLLTSAIEAAEGGHRLFGYYGVQSGHLPYRTADGDYVPAKGLNKRAESYSEEDLLENPTLKDMTEAALTYLGHDSKPFWLMVEAGDVDWANHDNNIDNSIGAVISGDMAVRQVAEWVEKNSSWDETVMIVTADHAHLFVLERPELLIGSEVADETALAQ